MNKILLIKNRIIDWFNLTWVIDQEEIKLSVISLVKFSFLFILIGLVLLFFVNISLRDSLTQPINYSTRISSLIEDVQSEFHNFLSNSWRLRIGSLVFGSIILNLVYVFMTWIVRIFIRWNIFNHKEFIEDYILLKREIDDKTNNLVSQSQDFLISILLLLAVVTFVIVNYIDYVYLPRYLMWFIVIISIIILLIEPFQILFKIRTIPEVSLESKNRYLVYRATRMFSFLFFSLFIIQLGIPTYVSYTEKEVRGIYFPKLIEEFDLIRHNLEFVQIDSGEKEQFNIWLDSSIKNAESKTVFISASDISELRGILSDTIVLVMGVGFVLYFIVPFYKFRKFMRAFAYSVLFLIFYIIEEIFLQETIPRIFITDFNIDIMPVFICFLIFMYSFITDWLHETIENKNNQCLSCHKLIDDDAKFCKYCGHQQHVHT